MVIVVYIKQDSLNKKKRIQTESLFTVLQEQQ